MSLRMIENGIGEEQIDLIGPVAGSVPGLNQTPGTVRDTVCNKIQAITQGIGYTLLATGGSAACISFYGFHTSSSEVSVPTWMVGSGGAFFCVVACLGGVCIKKLVNSQQVLDDQRIRETNQAAEQIFQAVEQRREITIESEAMVEREEEALSEINKGVISLTEVNRKLENTAQTVVKQIVDLKHELVGTAREGEGQIVPSPQGAYLVSLTENTKRESLAHKENHDQFMAKTRASIQNNSFCVKDPAQSMFASRAVRVHEMKISPFRSKVENGKAAVTD